MYIQYAYVILPYVNRTLTSLHNKTRKPSCRWQTRATRKHAKIAPVRRAYNVVADWSIFIRLAVVASEICEIPRNSLKIQTYRVQGHPRSSILVSIESAYEPFHGNGRDI